MYLPMLSELAVYHAFFHTRYLIQLSPFQLYCQVHSGAYNFYNKMQVNMEARKLSELVV